MWNLKQKHPLQTHKYQEQIGDCQRQGPGGGGGEMGEGSQKV